MKVCSFDFSQRPEDFINETGRVISAPLNDRDGGVSLRISSKIEKRVSSDYLKSKRLKILLIQKHYYKILIMNQLYNKYGKRA